MYIPTYDDVVAAHERIRPYIHRTPVLTSSYFDDRTGAELFFKCENFQKAGAFKARGASNAVFGLSEEQAAKGVATHSSGNHGLSLSYAAGRRGIKATVVMPRTAPKAKKEAVRGYGGTVVECEPSTSSREAVFAEVVAESGADFVHPYNDPRVIQGQATCSKELIEDVGELDAVIDEGIAFRTSGCPGKVRDDISACDRPYGDSPPSDIASYPFKLNRRDVARVRRQLAIPVQRV